MNDAAPSNNEPFKPGPGWRFRWSCILLAGGPLAIIQGVNTCARHEKLCMDFLGDLHKLPKAAQAAIQLQRALGGNILYLAVALFLPLLVWIWCARRVQVVRPVVLSVVGLCIVQMILSIAATAFPVAQLVKSLGGSVP